MRRRGMSCDGERCAPVIGQHRRAIDRRVGRCGDGVVGRLGRNRQRHGCGGRLSGGVGGGVGERVWAGVSGRRGVGVGAVGGNRDSAVGRGGVASDGQAGSKVVRKYRRPLECSVGSGETGIAGGKRRHGQADRGCRAVAGCVSGGVGKGVRARVARGRRIGIGTVGRHADGAVGRSRVRGDRESRADIVGEDAGAVQRAACRCSTAVAYGLRVDDEIHRGGCCLPGRVGSRIGERVQPGISSRWRVGVGAIGQDGKGAVCWVRVCRDGQPDSGIIGEHGRTRQSGVRRRRSCVVDGSGRDRKLHGRGRGVAGGIACGVGERVWPGVAGRWCVRVRTIRCNCNDSMAGGRR